MKFGMKIVPLANEIPFPKLSQLGELKSLVHEHRIWFKIAEWRKANNSIGKLHGGKLSPCIMA